MKLFSIEPSHMEQEAIRALSNAQLAQRRGRQAARKQPPAPNNSVGMNVVLALIIISVPYCIVMSVLQHDAGFLVAAIIGLVVAPVVYWALARRAWYWREHWLLAQEQQRRTTQ